MNYAVMKWEIRSNKCQNYCIEKLRIGHSTFTFPQIDHVSLEYQNYISEGSFCRLMAV